MEPIFDRRGAVVAWKRQDRLYHLDGSNSAFMDGDNVVAYSGKHLGVLDRGLFRDHSGGAVAFMKSATGGPILPIPSIPPIAPILAISPIPPIPPIPPIQAIASLGWAKVEWNEFISE